MQTEIKVKLVTAREEHKENQPRRGTCVLPKFIIVSMTLVRPLRHAEYRRCRWRGRLFPKMESAIALHADGNTCGQ